jgi:hypothetical protein
MLRFSRIQLLGSFLLLALVLGILLLRALRVVWWSR